MKNQKLLKNLRHRLSLLLCLMAFLAVGQSAWAKLYVYGSAEQNDNVDNYTYLGETDGLSFTWNGTFTAGRWRRVIFEKSKTGGKSGFLNDGIYCKSASRDESKFSAASSQEWGDVYSLQFTPSSTLSSVTIAISENPSSKSCDFQKKSGVYCADYTITAGTSATAPTVRLGDKPEETDSYDVNVSAYVAATGCADITKFTIYYSKTTISGKSGSGVYKKEFSQSSAPALGSITQLTLPSGDLATNGWGTGGDLYIRITGTNSAGESGLSDEIKLNYTVCAGIITSLQINPQGKQLAVNTAQTFTYTANDGATVNSVQWYKDGSLVATTTDYTFTPTTGDQFTIGLKAFNSTCNPDGFDAATQTYTVCVPIGEVTITDCPTSDVALGQPLTIHASLATGSGDATWVWTVNGAEQEVTVEGLTSSITYTPQSATTYMVIAKATDCTGAEKTAACNFVVKKAFTANNLNKTFNACAGGHQFNWADMFTPTPDSWSAVETTGGTDATALFTLKNGIMTWNNEGKAGGEYSYTFTAVKDGYKNATAELTFSYTAATAPTGTIGEISITGGETPTYPWTAVNLQCSVDGSDIANVVWSSSNSGLVVSTGIAEGTATAYFKGKVVKKDTAYTITAEGQSETCGSTAPQTITITVKPEEEEVCY